MAEKPKPQEITACPEWGKGGSYTLDPKTGVRTLVERGGQAGPQQAVDAAPGVANSVPTSGREGNQP